MKQIYIAPAIKITYVEMQPLMEVSGGGEQEFSKEHNSFWDNSFWGDDDEEQEAMFQQPKSLWED